MNGTVTKILIVSLNKSQYSTLQWFTGTKEEQEYETSIENATYYLQNWLDEQDLIDITTNQPDTIRFVNSNK